MIFFSISGTFFPYIIYILLMWICIVVGLRGNFKTLYYSKPKAGFNIQHPDTKHLSRHSETVFNSAKTISQKILISSGFSFSGYAELLTEKLIVRWRDGNIYPVNLNLQFLRAPPFLFSKDQLN